MNCMQTSHVDGLLLAQGLPPRLQHYITAGMFTPRMTLLGAKQVCLFGVVCVRIRGVVACVRACIVLRVVCVWGVCIRGVVACVCACIVLRVVCVWGVCRGVVACVYVCVVCTFVIKVHCAVFDCEPRNKRNEFLSGSRVLPISCGVSPRSV